MNPLILTVVRHGESTDNIKALWAGLRDAPLTNHGFAQATRLGKHFTDVPITAIYCSDLKRAHTTASCIHNQNKSQPTPPFTVSPLLREQFFGEAEGLSWSEGRFAFDAIPWNSSRIWSFPAGESLDDVGARARAALRHFVVPHLLEDKPQQHIVLVAHGIFLDELLRALGGPEEKGEDGTGFTNTGWARVELSVIPGKAGKRMEDTPTLRPAPPHEFAPRGPALPEREGQALPPYLSEDVPNPAFAVKVLALNQREHLEGLVRTKGGTGSSAHDPNQPRIQDFLGGGGTKAKV